MILLKQNIPKKESKGEVPGGVPTRQAMFVFPFQYPAGLIDNAILNRLTVSLRVAGPSGDLPVSVLSFSPRLRYLALH